MQIVKPIQDTKAQTFVQNKRLLFVGPKPPPIGGSPLTVRAMLAELSLYPSVSVTVINSSPALDVRKKMTGFNFEKVRRTLLIIPQYIQKIGACDVVLVFANDLFAITLAPLLLLIARLFRKPFYLKPVGAGLDLFLDAQIKPLRAYLLFVLRAADGILTQTRLLKEDLGRLGCANTYYLPGCRPLPTLKLAPKQSSSEFRMIFLGHITRLKGPLYLLDALKIASEKSTKPISCDFFGPIHEEIHADFLDGLQSTPNAHYCGVAEAGTGPQLIAQYDALVLPTYYDTEGHPGVFIEAMHAGVPVISTRVRTFPELITNGINGLLVPTQNSELLARAILMLAEDPDLRKKMGLANFIKGKEFQAETVVSTLLKIVFPDASLIKEIK